MFNNPESACRTCGGLGVDKLTHPELLIPDPKRSILGGCFVREAFKYNPDTWDGRVMFSLSKSLEFLARHAVEGPAREGAPRDPLRHRSQEDRADLAARSEGQARRSRGQGGRLRRHRPADRAVVPALPAARRSQLADGGVARQGDGRAHLPRLQRRAAARDAAAVHHRGQDHPRRGPAPLRRAARVPRRRSSRTGRGADAGRQVLKEIRGRLELLLGIGLDYLSFNRRSGTLSGGESQRIRLSTQIGSGLMGMLYVLDEPSIGLHPKDNVKMIATLESLRDIGNTVIVVEHDEDTIRAADHIVEMGPGPGVHGGNVVVQGTFEDVLKSKASPTGQFLSGKRIDCACRSSGARATARSLTVRGARENNLKDVDVAIPLGKLVAITGASGSGKSTLVNEILYKALWKRLVDTRTLPGEHDGGRWHRARAQGGEHRPVADRTEQPVESGDLHRLLRHHPRPVHAGAALGGARLQGRAVQLQRQGRALRGMSGRGRDHHAALFHAGRRGHLRRVQGRALQQRDARGHAPRQDDRRRAEHVGGGGRRVLRGGAGHPQEDRGA